MRLEDRAGPSAGRALKMLYPEDNGESLKVLDGEITGSDIGRAREGYCSISVFLVFRREISPG